MRASIGTVYLFGFLPVYRGLYANDFNSMTAWHDGLRWWIKPFVKIRWKLRMPQGPDQDPWGMM